MNENIWRLQLKTGKGIRIVKYCIENNIAAMGWCYANGDGCEIDRILGDKLLDIIDKQRIYRYYGWEKNKF